jgi:hypothetical protein
MKKSLLFATTAILIAIPGVANADSLKDLISPTELVTACTGNVGTYVEVTAIDASGQSITGQIECEAEDLVPGSDDDSPDGVDDDSSDDDSSDDDSSDDDSSDDDSSDDDSSDDDSSDDDNDDNDNEND